MRHVLEAQEFSPELLNQIFDRTTEFKRAIEDGSFNEKFGNLLKDKMMFTIFYEPSTRTRISFTAAGQHLGMATIGTENAKEFSSAAKGETLEDTVRTLCEYNPDVIVRRHPDTDAAKTASKVSTVPIINAGDGMGQHPTQALLDLYTIYEEIGRMDNLKVVAGGDLAHGRTVRSLTYLLSKFPSNKLTFVSPKGLEMGDDIKEYLKTKGVEFSETEDIKSALSDADVVYWTRTQKERFDSSKVTNSFIIGPEEMKLMKRDAVLLHPLPRVDEISVEVDSDPRAAYFRQAGNGMYTRMALIEWVLNEK
jgi:aspartate carbamoyltransferase catalytic subunit